VLSSGAVLLLVPWPPRVLHPGDAAIRMSAGDQRNASSHGFIPGLPDESPRPPAPDRLPLPSRPGPLISGIAPTARATRRSGRPVLSNATITSSFKVKVTTSKRSIKDKRLKALMTTAQ
jgi:hypothetical protein